MFEFERSQFFDQKNTKAYFNNPWDKKYSFGQYFAAIEELGCPLNIQIGLDQGSGTQWFQVPHALHDGYSALYTLLDEQGFKLKKVEFKLKEQRLKYKAFKCAKHALKNHEHKYKGQKQYTADQDFSFIMMELPLQKEFSDTATMTYILSKFLRETILPQIESKWMVPVRTDHLPGLRASYFGLTVHETDDILDIKNQIKEKLLAGEHKGLEFISKLGLKLGKKTILNQTKKMLDAETPGWAGSVSNLKNIGNCEELKKIIMLAPVRWHRPVGLAMYEFNQKQYLTLCVHESLAPFDFGEFKRRVYALS